MLFILFRVERFCFKKLKASQIVYINRNIQWLTALFQMFHDQSSLALGKCGLSILHVDDSKDNSSDGSEAASHDRGGSVGLGVAMIVIVVMIVLRLGLGF